MLLQNLILSNQEYDNKKRWNLSIADVHRFFRKVIPLSPPINSPESAYDTRQGLILCLLFKKEEKNK